jgi:hypothetical protein
MPIKPDSGTLVGHSITESGNDGEKAALANPLMQLFLCALARCCFLASRDF